MLSITSKILKIELFSEKLFKKRCGVGGDFARAKLAGFPDYDRSEQ